MADGSKVHWLADPETGRPGASWNVTDGCTKPSEECIHCYIWREAPLRMARRRFSKAGVGGRTDVQLHPERLPYPFIWRTGRRIFVDSLGDLFHDDVPNDLIAKVFAVMAATPHHTYVLLTKRHRRLRALLNSGYFALMVREEVWKLPSLYPKVRIAAEGLEHAHKLTQLNIAGAPLRALPNVELGVSAGNQRTADLRIPHLLAVMGDWTRVVSFEPLIGPIDPTRIAPVNERGRRRPGTIDALRGRSWVREIGGENVARIDGMFIGGESGPAAKPTELDDEPVPDIRPMELEWARRLVRLGLDAGAAVYMKQLGSVWAKANGARDRKGGDPDEWPEDLRVREYARLKVEQRGTTA